MAFQDSKQFSLQQETSIETIVCVGVKCYSVWQFSLYLINISKRFKYIYICHQCLESLHTSQEARSLDGILVDLSSAALNSLVPIYTLGQKEACSSFRAVCCAHLTCTYSTIGTQVVYCFCTISDIHECNFINF